MSNVNSDDSTPAGAGAPENDDAKPKRRTRGLPFRVWGGWAVGIVAAIITVVGQKQTTVITADNKRLEAELAQRDAAIADLRRQAQAQGVVVEQTRHQLSEIAGKLQTYREVVTQAGFNADQRKL